ncbi:hypothetical protein ON010_g18487 [Phytophthora cinnamomi]|nr:hypothetical protein ON010_g18487 [Phytophthora cinnamomi]
MLGTALQAKPSSAADSADVPTIRSEARTAAMANFMALDFGRVVGRLRVWEEAARLPEVSCDVLLVNRKVNKAFPSAAVKEAECLFVDQMQKELPSDPQTHVWL